VQLTMTIDHGNVGLNFPRAKTFQTSPHMLNFEAKEPKLYLKRCIFLDKGSSQGRIPGLLDHGSKIPVAIL
jgi:hypothetical protein